MSTPVITVSSRTPTESYYKYREFLASLKKFGVDPIVLGADRKWEGLMTKAFLYWDWLHNRQHIVDTFSEIGAKIDTTGGNGRVILCDAWDIVFAADPDRISGLCAGAYGDDAVVFNGEKACWPRGDLSDTFPDQGYPWRYLNCGFICGPASSILAMLEAMNLESIGVDRVENGKKIEPNDQGEFQALFSKQPVKMVVDAKCVAAQTLSACTMEEFDLSGPEIVNKVTGTMPGVFHFNGDAKNKLMPAFLQKLGL